MLFVVIKFFLVLILFIWITTFIFGVFITFGTNSTERDCLVWRVVHPIVVHILTFFVVITMFVVVILYTKIYIKIMEIMHSDDNENYGNILRGTMTLMRNSWESKRLQKERHQKYKEMRTTIMIMLIVFFFVFCWMPGVIAVFISYIDESKADGSFDFACVMYGLNSALNPFFYAFHVKHLRKRVKKTWKQARRASRMFL